MDVSFDEVKVDLNNLQKPFLGLQHFDVVLKANGCVHKDELLHEWQKLKLHITSNHKKLKFNDVWECIISQKSERYSNVLHVVRIVLAVPISTSHVERLFSGIKHILGEQINSANKYI